MKVVFGTRGSALALAQTKHVIARLKACHPDTEAEIAIIKTKGDRLAQAPLSEIGGLGAFTREIEQALLSGEIDVAVHSLKDLPVEQPEGLRITAIAGRQSPADVLVSRTGLSLDSLPEGARVGTSSLRRKVQLLLARPDLCIGELRGNVPTRMAAAHEGQFDAVVIALAGLARLGLDHEPGLRELTLSQMLPAPGQGALALEIQTGASTLARLLQPLHDETAATGVLCERAILKAFGGGCRSPLGAYARCDGDKVLVEALAADPENSKQVRIQRDGARDNALELGLAIGRELHNGLKAK